LFRLNPAKEIIFMKRIRDVQGAEGGNTRAGRPCHCVRDGQFIEPNQTLEILMNLNRGGVAEKIAAERPPRSLP
jgi:hypothetical protein